MPDITTTSKLSTTAAAPKKPVLTSMKPAHDHVKSAPTSPKPKIEPVIKTTTKSKSTLVKPAKLQLKPANEAQNRKRLCSSEEVSAKKQGAIETRNRKQSEKEAKEIEARNKIIYEKIMFAEKDKVVVIMSTKLMTLKLSIVLTFMTI